MERDEVNLAFSQSSRRIESNNLPQDRVSTLEISSRPNGALGSPGDSGSGCPG